MRVWRYLLIWILGSLIFSTTGDAQENALLNPQNPLIRSNRLGITHINSAEIGNSEERYQNAQLLGAGWNRWPLYWNVVEVGQGQFNWSAYDNVVIEDVRHGFNINAILLGRPDFYADGNTIAGINEPIFADGSDTPGQGKAINPANPWANFVYQAVQRYKKGGVLAQQQGWINEGVDIWEIWNEPDLAQFWQGSIPQYARLLKVAYLAAHQADPTASVMYGGLLFSTPNNWLARVLAIYENDPQARNHGMYMDAVALHSYSYPWRTGWLTLFVRDTLRAYGLQKPIFVNETGISIWDDYPGPLWSTTSTQRYKMGTANQQAWFFIQSTVYAWSEGADVVFFHQLYDDCGDQAAGTNFPFHRGELCGAGQACSGDAFGLFRNPSNAICYSQHPNPGTARPSAAAFRMMTQVFGAASFVGGEETRVDGYTIFNFERPATRERILVIWNRRFEPNKATIPAISPSATLYTMQGTNVIAAQNGNYVIALNAAVPDNFPDLEPIDISAIAGEPVILVESLTGEGALSVQVPIDLSQSEASVEASQQVPIGTVQGGPLPVDATTVVRIVPNPTLRPQATSTQLIPTVGPVIAPTIAPEDDQSPPVPYMNPLPEISARTFIVSWGAEDDGQIDRYVVWVQINAGDWQPWLETQRSESIYTGIPGNTYRFAVWAVDTAGNWSTNIELEPQTQTVVQ